MLKQSCEPCSNKAKNLPATFQGIHIIESMYILSNIGRKKKKMNYSSTPDEFVIGQQNQIPSEHKGMFEACFQLYYFNASFLSLVKASKSNR